MDAEGTPKLWISGVTRMRDPAGNTAIAVTIETDGMRWEIECPNCQTFDDAEAYARSELYRVSAKIAAAGGPGDGALGVVQEAELDRSPGEEREGKWREATRPSTDWVA